MNTQSHTDQVLRELGRRAAGLSPADVERIVRESRQAARRADRTLEFNDLLQALGQAKPPLPAHVRRRLAIHEAGHFVAHLTLGVGRISAISIETMGGGGWMRMEQPLEQEATEDHLEKMLVIYLAGRVAEEQILGNVVAGSGGDARSDLAMATRLAVDMETKFGFGGDLSLVYLDVKDIAWTLLSHKELAQRVNARLCDAEMEARNLISRNNAEIEIVVDTLLTNGTLEGELLKSVFEGLGSRSPI